MIPETLRSKLLFLLALSGLVAIALAIWLVYGNHSNETALASGNGRIEATEIDIAARTPGRLETVNVREGEYVQVGQIVAVMDTATLNAQLHQAEAERQQAQSGVAIARSQLAQRQADLAAVHAVLAQRQAELAVARKRADRSTILAREGAGSQQEADDDQARVQSARAAVRATQAQLTATTAAIATATAQLSGAESSVQAADAAVHRFGIEIDQASLRAPRSGRVQYIVARTGEVVGAGERIIDMIDLSEVYMTFFLPTAAAGRLSLGEEVRLVLDAAPQYVIPARISFVADVAQFTPKTVETRAEREKLMFRVRASIDPALLARHLRQIKTGLPGVAYVRLDPRQPWPARLTLNLPPQ